MSTDPEEDRDVEPLSDEEVAGLRHLQQRSPRDAMKVRHDVIDRLLAEREGLREENVRLRRLVRLLFAADGEGWPLLAYYEQGGSVTIHHAHGDVIVGPDPALSALLTAVLSDQGAAGGDGEVDADGE